MVALVDSFKAGSRRTDSSTKLWLLIWAGTLCVPWLMPAISLPWPSFDMEAAAAVSGLLLVAVLIRARSGKWAIPRSAMAVALVSAIPLVQFAAGEVLFFGDAWICFLYIFGFATAVVVGAEAARRPDWQAAMFFAFAFAAMASVGIQLKQWLNVEGLYGWTRDMPPGGRPFANIGQPNNLATLICWGLIADWWAYQHKKVGGKAALFLAAYLLFGLSLTQSRSGWLMAATLVLSALPFGKQLGAGRYQQWLLVLAVLFAFYVLTLDRLNSALDAGAATDLSDRLTPGYRLLHWKVLTHALLAKPWLGWGWDQVSVAQQAVVIDFPAVPELLGYSHNIVLDLLIWNGIPLGVLLSLGSLFWLVKAGKQSRSDNVHLYLCVVVVTIHCMLEYPHSYAYFLVPCGFMVGALTVAPGTRTAFMVSRRFLAPAALLLAGGVVWTSLEYLEASANLTALRYEKAHIGAYGESRAPKLFLLTQLTAIATLDRMPIRERASDSDVNLSRRTAERFPAERTLMQYAAIAAGRADTAAAQLSLMKLCKLYPADRCAFAATVWKIWGDKRFPWVKDVPFPVTLESSRP